VTANLAALSVAAELSAQPSSRGHRIRFQIFLRSASARKGNCECERLVAEQFKSGSGAFEQIRLIAETEHFDWINFARPVCRQLSAHLWTTHQLDAFRNAATDYGTVCMPWPSGPPAIRRLVYVVGQGANSAKGHCQKAAPAWRLFYSRESREWIAAAARRGGGAGQGASPLPMATGTLMVPEAPLSVCAHASLLPGTGAGADGAVWKAAEDIERPGMGPRNPRTLLGPAEACRSWPAR